MRANLLECIYMILSHVNGVDKKLQVLSQLSMSGSSDILNVHIDIVRSQLLESPDECA